MYTNMRILQFLSSHHFESQSKPYQCSVHELAKNLYFTTHYLPAPPHDCVLRSEQGNGYLVVACVRRANMAILLYKEEWRGGNKPTTLVYAMRPGNLFGVSLTLLSRQRWVRLTQTKNYLSQELDRESFFIGSTLFGRIFYHSDSINTNVIDGNCFYYAKSQI